MTNSKQFTELTGYNANKHVKSNHVFIDGKGSFWETPELARANNRKTGNEVGLYIEEIEHEGRIVFREMNENVWN